MSGGSYNYIYSRLSEECENRMYDAEMNDLIKDLCEVLHDLEWWQSCDFLEEKYRKTLSEFKKKWFKGDREQRLKGDNIMNNPIDKLKKYSERFCKNNHCKIVDTYCDIDTLMYRVIGIGHHNAYRFVFYYDEDFDTVQVLESRSGLLSL